MVDDELLFIDEACDEAPGAAQPWPVLLVDDERDMHDVTRLALDGLRFRNRPLGFTSAYSGAEACKLLRQGTEFAVIVLDVVMETDDAGLGVVQVIRDELGNRRTRIILRTGQPGQAPERRVILDYDINDYKAKTELTSEKLFVTMVASLRAYDDIITIERARRQLEINRRGLLKIIEASPTIFRAESFANLAQGALEQLQSLVCPEQETLFARVSGIALDGGEPDSHVLAGTGRYSMTAGRSLRDAVDSRLLPVIEAALARHESVTGPDYVVAVVNTEGGGHNVLVIDGAIDLSAADAELTALFCRHVGLAYETLSRLTAV